MGEIRMIPKADLKADLMSAIEDLFDSADTQDTGALGMAIAKSKIERLAGPSFAEAAAQLATVPHVRCSACDRAIVADMIRADKCGACIVDARVQQ